MSLSVARSKLKLTLIFGEDIFGPGNIANTIQQVEDWWGAYKEWEAEDTFYAAVSEGRMTVSQRPFSQTHEGLSMVRQAEPDKGKQDLGGSYNVGLTGLTLRTNPASFDLTADGERGKYALGLHDLSGSLLNPARPSIFDQLNSKSDAAGSKLRDWVVVFMPVAGTEDHVVFNLLNAAAKEVRDRFPLFYRRVQEMRRRMSRIKLAEEKDMHCGFVDVSTGATAADAPLKKYRYGLGSVKAGKLTPHIAERRKNLALHYNSILARTTGYNEIIIAYREHASGHFPVAARWDFGALPAIKRFRVVRDVAGTETATTVFIPDAWRTLAGGVQRSG
jgi:hypothetical protein